MSNHQAEIRADIGRDEEQDENEGVGDEEQEEAKAFKEAASQEYNVLSSTTSLYLEAAVAEVSFVGPVAAVTSVGSSLKKPAAAASSSASSSLKRRSSEYPPLSHGAYHRSATATTTTSSNNNNSNTSTLYIHSGPAPTNKE
jgi:hypothetical protein